MVDAPVVEEAPRTGPPVVFLLLGLLSVLASIFLLVHGGFAANVLGYVLASVLPILSVGLFRHFDLDRRISPYYVPSQLVRYLIPIVLALGLIAAVLHTWSIATEIAS